MAATIVVAEDETDLRSMYVDCLRRAGHCVYEACDGAEAISRVRDHAPDLLLLDIWMPNLNGLEVLEHLGRAPEAIGLKIVVLSHAIDSDTRLEGYALGASDYWIKDLTLVELCSRIEQLVGSSVLP